MQKLEDKFFLFLVIAVSLAFLWILTPYFGAILWGIIAAVVFAPLNRSFLVSMPGRRNLAAMATVVIVIILVIMPLAIISTALLQQASGLFAAIQSGEIDFGSYFHQAVSSLPTWASGLLARFGLTDFEAVQQKITAGLAAGSEVITAQIISISQNTLNFIIGLFVMLYLLFFLLREGDALLRRIWEETPLHADKKRALLEKFTVVIRATVRGNILVAIVQGALGGFIFWFLGIRAALLWGVVMTFLSLVPAVGASLVWLPAALYFLLTGAVWQGIVLIAWGALVIGLIDNILRPILVGQDTRLPDYVVLISTLGGLSIFGINGLILGPMIAAIFVSIWHIFMVEEGKPR